MSCLSIKQIRVFFLLFNFKGSMVINVKGEGLILTMMLANKWQ